MKFLLTTSILGSFGLASSFWFAPLYDTAPELPAQSCDSAQNHGLSYGEAIPAPPPPPKQLPHPTVSNVQPPSQLPSIFGKGGKRIQIQDFLPHELPLQPFEGAPEDIALIGDALRSAQKDERLRLTFFGASHTGGEYWTGHIRRVLQSRYGDGGHGFIMPAALYESDRASDINRCSSEWDISYVGRTNGLEDNYYGLGFTARSNDPSDFAWIETTHKNPHGRHVSSYDILTLGTPDGGGLMAQIDRNQPVVIPTFSPYPELNHVRIEVPEGPHRLSIQPAGDGEIRLFGVSAERSGPGVVVDAIGIRGREARTWLHWNDLVFQDALRVLFPDIVVLAYGTNEANALGYDMETYADDLRKVLRKLRQASPNAGCILVGPSDRAKKVSKGYRVWDRTALVAEVQRQVAPEFRCVFWDWQQATGGEGSMVAWHSSRPPLGKDDLIHFTPKGYVHSAELFIAALDDAMSNYGTEN